MATVITFDRRRRFARPPVSPTERAASVEQFWRKVVAPITVAAGAALIVALGLAIGFYVTGALPKGYETAAMITMVVAVVGLTKIIFANAIFWVMVAEERAAELHPPQPAARPATFRVPIRPVPHRRSFR